MKMIDSQMGLDPALEQEWKEYIKIVSNNKSMKYIRKSVEFTKSKKAYITGNCIMNDCVIGITNSSREVLCYDTIHKKYIQFGKVKIGTFKWTGGCCYKNKVYGFPRKENSVLMIDPMEKSCAEKKLGLSYKGEHHYGGVLTPDGVVYQPPRNTDHVLVINLNTFETSHIPIPEADEKARYSASVLHPSGRIYLIPEYGYKVAILNPKTKQIELIGEKFDHLVFGCVVGYDQNIYGYSKEGDGILKIDTITNKIEWICREIGNPDCYGSIVGVNGKIYGVPAASQKIYEFDIENQRAVAIFWLEEKGIAKCAGACMDENGTIYMLPCFGEHTYILEADKVVNKVHSVEDNMFINTCY